MQIEIKLDDSFREPKVLICAAAVTEEVQDILDRLSEQTPRIITGLREEKLEVLEPEKLIRIYASGGKVLAVTEQGEYILRQRLYELEKQLDGRKFVRISNSEMINLSQVRTFDLSFTGTVCVRLSNGDVTYVSRRCVPKIKKILGI